MSHVDLSDVVFELVEGAVKGDPSDDGARGYVLQVEAELVLGVEVS